MPVEFDVGAVFHSLPLHAAIARAQRLVQVGSRARRHHEIGGPQVDELMLPIRRLPQGHHARCDLAAIRRILPACNDPLQIGPAGAFEQGITVLDNSLLHRFLWVEKSRF